MKNDKIEFSVCGQHKIAYYLCDSIKGPKNNISL